MARLVMILLGVDYLRTRWRGLLWLGCVSVLLGVVAFVDALDNAIYFPMTPFAVVLLLGAGGAADRWLLPHPHHAPSATTAAPEGDDGAVTSNSYDWSAGDTRTIAFWMRANDLTDPLATMISLGNTLTSGARFDIRLQTGTTSGTPGASGLLRLEVQGGFVETTTTDLTNAGLSFTTLRDGLWHHIAVVVPSATATVPKPRRILLPSAPVSRAPSFESLSASACVISPRATRSVRSSVTFMESPIHAVSVAHRRGALEGRS